MAAFQMPEGTGIFLMPSGSDAEYIPLLICKIFNQGKEIVSVVTCNEEVGSGTLDAAGGRFFSPMEPIKGFTNGEVKMSDPVEGMTEGVQTIPINARKPEGDTVDARDKTREILEDCKSKGKVPIVHVVYGSKTGICEPFDDQIIQEAQSLNGLLVVDACQGRFGHKFMTQALEKEACVLFTGSKFFRGPPFSGAVIVPASIMKKLQDNFNQATVPVGLNTFFGRSELPPQLKSWRDSVKDSVNSGLALRW